MASKKRDPSVTYSSGGELYGPMQPEGFSVADLDKKNPLKEQESEEEEQVNDNPNATGGVSATGDVKPHPSSSSQPNGLLEEDLAKMGKPELVQLAESKGITVTRADGSSGDPTKQDYVAQLAGK